MDLPRATAIAAAFDLGRRAGTPSFVARGAMGEIWRLRTLDGGSWAVKTLFSWAVDASGADVDVQEAAAGAGIRVPAPRRAQDGQVIVGGARVYEWVDLARLPRPATDDVLGEVGRILGTLHGLALRPDPDDAVDEWYTRAPTAEQLLELAERGERAGRAWARLVRARAQRIEELCALVATTPHRADDVIVGHRDFTADNVFRAMDGGPLVVLDWENAGPLSAEAELGMTVAAWCPASDVDPAALLGGYAAGGGTASITGAAGFATSAATVLNYLQVMADQSLEDDEHRAFADAALEGILRRGLDAAVPRGWMA